MENAGANGKFSEIMMLPLAAKALNVIAEIGVSDFIGTESIHMDDLSDMCRIEKGMLLNLLKTINIFGFFDLEKQPLISNNELSLHLMTDHPQSMKHFCLLFGHEYYNAYDGLLHTAKTKNSGFKHVYGQTLYSYLEDTPERALVYDLAMRDFSRPVGAVIAKTFEDLFSTSHKVMDIGGGSGIITIEILKQFEHIEGCIFDREDVCERNKSHLPANVKDKITLYPGDFFKEVPTGYDVYILKNVLHNWNDESCKEILNVISQSIGEARLIIVEPVVTKEDNSPRLVFNAVFQSVICEDGTHPRDIPNIESLLDGTGMSIAKTQKLATGHTAFEVFKSAK